MSCEEFGLAIIDDAAPRPEELETHLSGCPHCQAVASAHRSAQRLRNLRVDLPAPARSVRVGVPRRRRLALGGAFAALGVAVVAALLITASKENASLSGLRANDLPASPSQTQAQELRPVLHPDSLEALLHEVNSYTRQDVSANDETLEAFGELPQLLAPNANAVSATGGVPGIGGLR